MQTREREIYRVPRALDVEEPRELRASSRICSKVAIVGFPSAPADPYPQWRAPEADTRLLHDALDTGPEVFQMAGVAEPDDDELVIGPGSDQITDADHTLDGGRRCRAQHDADVVHSVLPSRLVEIEDLDRGDMDLPVGPHRVVGESRHLGEEPATVEQAGQRFGGRQCGCLGELNGGGSEARTRR